MNTRMKRYLFRYKFLNYTHSFFIICIVHELFEDHPTESKDFIASCTKVNAFNLESEYTK